MRRAATLLLTATLSSAGLAAVAPPAGAAGIVARDLTITVTGLGPENRTCRIDADLYVPPGVRLNRPAPALLATNGFGGTKEDQADLAQGFGRHGYVTLSYTGIGFVDGDSCPITLDDREHDGAAAGQLLRFLGGDPSIAAVDDATGQQVVVREVIREDRATGTRYDPAVGMIGGSYGGQIQFAYTAGFERAAGTDRLDAIVPHPSQASIDCLRSNSVASYIGDIRVPTLIGQGQADTLFNLQESVATYTALRRQGTPVSLVWQPWGHSDSSPVAGELDLRHPEASHQGRKALAWFEHYVRGRGPAPRPDFSYYRDWVFEATGDVRQAYASAPSFPVGTERTLYLSSQGPAGASLVAREGAVASGTSTYASTAPVGPNYTETSALDQSQPVFDPPGSSVLFATEPLPAPLDVVGSPRLTVTLDSTAAATQGLGPDGQLVAFAKLYDLGPDGAPVELPHRLISPVRIGSLPGPVTVELPGIVHRFDAGHRLAVVLAGGDMAYRGSTLRQSVSLTTGAGVVQELTLPVVP